jgi:hypothetical protein
MPMVSVGVAIAYACFRLAPLKKRNAPRTARMLICCAVSVPGLNTNLSMRSFEFGPTTIRVSSLNWICASPTEPVRTWSPMKTGPCVFSSRVPVCPEADADWTTAIVVPLGSTATPCPAVAHPAIALHANNADRRAARRMAPSSPERRPRRFRRLHAIDNAFLANSVGRGDSPRLRALKAGPHCTLWLQAAEPAPLCCVLSNVPVRYAPAAKAEVW